MVIGSKSLVARGKGLGVENYSKEAQGTFGVFYITMGRCFVNCHQIIHLNLVDFIVCKINLIQCP